MAEPVFVGLIQATEDNWPTEGDYQWGFYQDSETSSSDTEREPTFYNERQSTAYTDTGPSLLTDRQSTGYNDWEEQSVLTYRERSDVTIRGPSVSVDREQTGYSDWDEPSYGDWDQRSYTSRQYSGYNDRNSSRYTNRQPRFAPRTRGQSGDKPDGRYHTDRNPARYQPQNSFRNNPSPPVRPRRQQRSRQYHVRNPTRGQQNNQLPDGRVSSTRFQTKSVPIPPITPAPKQSGSLLVGSIDFGTTYSGWAFSFAHDFRAEPTKVFTKHWYSESQLTTEKAPTCALIRPDRKTLEAFGYEAENRYRELVHEGSHRRYYYFRRFKMTLDKSLQKGVRRDFKLHTTTGQTLSALTVFSLVIEYLTTDMLKEVNSRMLDQMSMRDIQWVLTVPAIWTDPAKQFMREAAAENRKQPLSTVAVHQHDVTIPSFPPGKSYMIVDAGGGTVDITVHQVEPSGGLKEVHAASGGGWGGTVVDEAFESLLIDLLGADVYRKFEKQNIGCWLDLWRDFELKKRSIGPKKDTRFVMRIPISLVQLYKKETGQDLKKAIASSEYSEGIFQVSDKLKISANIARSLFDNAVDKTVSHVKSMMKYPKVRQIQAILMVGGFSDSPMLQQALQEAFPRYDVVVPPEAVTSVLKGAVIFGHSPKSITERVLKYTYGVNTTVQFRRGVHPWKKRIFTDNGVKCKDIFSKFVEVGQAVPEDATEEKKYMPVYHSQHELVLNVYATKEANPRFVDRGCSKIGEFTVAIPWHDGDMKNAVYVSLKFGKTEITATGRDDATGDETIASFNFLL